MNVKIKKVENPIIIVGFHGRGVVGTIASQYLIEKLNFKEIGYIYDSNFPGVAVLENGKVNFPIKIYGKGKFIIITSELPLPKALNKDIAKAIVEIAKKLKAKLIIAMEGLSVFEEVKDRHLYYVSTFDLKKKITPLDSGIIAGIIARILLESKNNNIKAVCLMSEALPSIPDGKAAAKVLEGLNKLVNIKVDVNELIKEADAFEKKISELAEKVPKEEEREVKYLYG